MIVTIIPKYLKLYIDKEIHIGDNEKELLECICKINELRTKEKDLLDQMSANLSCHPIKICDDEITKLL